MSETGRNQQQIRELDARFRAPLMKYFLRRVGKRSDAEDLTQETFTRLIGSETFDPSGNLPGYVFRIASNLLRDRAKATSRHPEFPFSALNATLVENIFNEIAQDFGPERVLIGREKLAEVLACLDELGERTKTVFILFRLEGMKHKDIAEMFGVSISTVEKSCMAAMTLLMARFRSKP